MLSIQIRDFEKHRPLGFFHFSICREKQFFVFTILRLLFKELAIRLFKCKEKQPALFFIISPQNTKITLIE